MSQTFDFYDTRAREASAEAKQATLQNVKERHLRAEKTWRSLADQAQKVASDRAKADKERMARREAEAEAQASSQTHG
ncbi:MAG: hypothetical protein AAFQ90_03775 [Pseudomonadota bacterium]